MGKKFLFVVLILLVGGCAHTNELMNYDLEGKAAYYEAIVDPFAGTIEVVVQQNKKEDEKKEKTDDLLSVVAAVSSEILSADKISKIKDLVDTEDMSYYINEGLKYTLETFVDFNEVESARDADFIVETKLESCKMNVSKTSVYVSVNASAEIIDRATGKTVWDDWESESVPVRQTYHRGQKKVTGTAEKLLTAVQLASLSEKEINNCIAEAVEEIGRKMGETFRDDLAEVNK